MLRSLTLALFAFALLFGGTAHATANAKSISAKEFRQLKNELRAKMRRNLPGPLAKIGLRALKGLNYSRASLIEAAEEGGFEGIHVKIGKHELLAAVGIAKDTKEATGLVLQKSRTKTSGEKTTNDLMALTGPEVVSGAPAGTYLVTETSNNHSKMGILRPGALEPELVPLP
jgi:hypothetical protein